MSVTIACSTALACELPVDLALRAMASIGVQDVDLLCIEGWAHLNPSELADNWPEQRRKLTKLLGENDLRIGALNTMTSAPLHHRSLTDLSTREREATALLALMRDLNINFAAVQPPLRRTQPWTDVEQDQAVISLREEVARARLAGKTFALELHSDSPFSTPTQLQRLLDAWPDVPLVFDPSHFVAHSHALDLIERTLARTQIIHLRDAAPGKLQTVFGQGMVTIEPFLKRLRDGGFSGVISIEYLGFRDAGFDVADSAQRLLSRVRDVFY